MFFYGVEKEKLPRLQYHFDLMSQKMFHCRHSLSVCAAGAVSRVVWNVRLCARPLVSKIKIAITAAVAPGQKKKLVRSPSQFTWARTETAVNEQQFVVHIVFCHKQRPGRSDRTYPPHPTNLY